MLSVLLTQVVARQHGKPVVCLCGARMKNRGLKERRLLSILGPIKFHRPYFKCPSCGKTLCPVDEALGISRTKYSPGLQRMMTRAGARSTFREGSEDLKIYAGIEVNAKAVERVAEASGEEMRLWAEKEASEALRAFEDESSEEAKDIPRMYIEIDGTGVPMVPAQLEGRKGKQPDGSAKTREVKLGCVFTQTARDEKGRPVRDSESCTFVGKIESAELFGERIFAEALRRGCDRASQIVVIGDGAQWISNIVQTNFHGAIHIIDLYHAKEHVSDLCKLLHPSNEKELIKHRLRWWTDLEEGNIEKILREAKRRLPNDKDTCEKVEKQIAYLNKNKERMRYEDYRARGFFVGSGVIEAGCKSIIGQRLKQSGMEWSLNGANAIISLRCMMKSNRTQDFWESKAAS